MADTGEEQRSLESAYPEELSERLATFQQLYWEFVEEREKFHTYLNSFGCEQQHGESLVQHRLRIAKICRTNYHQITREFNVDQFANVCNRAMEQVVKLFDRAAQSPQSEDIYNKFAQIYLDLASTLAWLDQRPEYHIHDDVDFSSWTHVAILNAKKHNATVSGFLNRYACKFFNRNLNDAEPFMVEILQHLEESVKNGSTVPQSLARLNGAYSSALSMI